MKIAFVYSNRSEYSELEPFSRFFAKKTQTFELNLSKHIQKIENDKNLFKIYEKCFKFFTSKKIEYVCILGDRREIPFIALAAFHLNIKIIHIAAGEFFESTSSYDQYFRPIVSLLSSYQICFSKIAKKEIEKLFNGISYLTPNAYVFGNPVFTEIDVKKLRRPIKENYDLVMLHPNSLSKEKTLKDVKNLEKKLENKKTIFIKGNKDCNYDIIENLFKKIKDNKKYSFYNSLPKKKYFSYVKYCDNFFTNSSSIHEIIKLNKKCLVVIGERNKNRSKEEYNQKSPILLFNLIKKNHNKKLKTRRKKT